MWNPTTSPLSQSRKFLTYKDSSLSEGMDMQVHTVYSNLPVSDTKLKEIQAETEKDSQLAQVRKVIHDRWPEERRKCPQSVKMPSNLEPS